MKLLIFEAEVHQVGDGAVMLWKEGDEAPVKLRVARGSEVIFGRLLYRRVRVVVESLTTEEE